MSYIKTVKYPIVEKELKEPFETVDYWDEDLEILDKDMKKRRYICEEILKRNVQARNSDFILLMECLRFEFRGIKVKSYGDRVVFDFPKEVFKKFVSPESFRRSRQQFNAKGLYLPTKEYVLERRKKKEATMRKYFGMLKEKKE